MFLVLLALSVVGLAAGPLLAAAGRGRVVPEVALDAFTLGVVPSVVVVRLLPHLVGEIGSLAVVLLAVGFAVAWAFEGRLHPHGAAHAVVLPTLALHSFLDGTALALAFAAADLQGAPTDAEPGARAGLPTLLGAAIVLHRLPEGLFIGRLLVPSLGLRRALGRVAWLAGATLVGAFAGRKILRGVPDVPLHAVVTLGLGVLLRLVTRAHEIATPSSLRGQRVAGAVGGALFAVGLVLPLLLPSDDDLFAMGQPHEVPFGVGVAGLLFASAPAFALGLALDVVLARRFSRIARDLPAFLWPSTVAMAVALLGPALAVLGVVPALAVLLVAGGRGASPATATKEGRQCATLEILRRGTAAYVVGLLTAAALEAFLPRAPFRSAVDWREALAAGTVAAVLGVVVAARIRAQVPAVLILVVLTHKGLALPITAAAVVALASATPRGMGDLRSGLVGPVGAAVLAATAVAFAGPTLALGAWSLPGATADLHRLLFQGRGPVQWSGAIVAVAGVLVGLAEGPRPFLASVLATRPLAASSDVAMSRPASP